MMYRTINRILLGLSLLLGLIAAQNIAAHDMRVLFHPNAIVTFDQLLTPVSTRVENAIGYKHNALPVTSARDRIIALPQNELKNLERIFLKSTYSVRTGNRAYTQSTQRFTAVESDRHLHDTGSISTTVTIGSLLQPTAAPAAEGVPPPRRSREPDPLPLWLSPWIAGGMFVSVFVVLGIVVVHRSSRPRR